MTEEFADLHMHSFYSDGLLSPEAIVHHAAMIGLRAIALTDHDTAEGYHEALGAGSRLGVEVISGIELSAMIDGRDAHILGYFFDPENFILQNALQKYKDARVERAKRILKKLEEFNIYISFEEVQAKAGRGVIARPHIADLLIEKGHSDNIYQVFNQYLGQDAAAYEEKYKISPVEAVDLIHQAGGLAVIAHPTLNLKESHVYEMIRAGVDGIECTHPKHTPLSATHFARIAAQHKILEAGGSDCHGRGQIQIGNWKIPYANIEKMKKRLEDFQNV